MKTALKIIIGLIFWLGIVQIWAATNITHFRVSNDPEKTRLVFELTDKPDYLLLTLTQPERLVLDIKNTQSTVFFNQHLLKDTPVKSIRIGKDKQTARLVLDLNRPVTAKSFVLAPADNYGYRLVVDLTKAPETVSAVAPVSHPATLAVLPEPGKLTIASMVKKAVAPKSPPPVVKPVVTPPPVKMGRPIIVVIDPGHGGKDPGTTGYSGTHEKDVVLAISKYLQRDLNNEPGFKAVLTRSSDYFVPLRGRLDIARKDKADIFIAIHADAFPTANAMGASVFALSERGATSEAARWLAEKENKSELLGGASLPDNDNVLRSVLIDLSQTNTISESLQVGSAVLRQLGNVTSLHHGRVEQAAFVVLKSPDIPSLLIETGFLSTPAQERQLRNPQYQNNLALAIMQGIKSYFVRNPPQGTVFSNA